MAGMIQVGDEVLEVNGIRVTGMEAEHVIKLLVGLFYVKVIMKIFSFT
jgi:C-terminal processing protease CtpA/Prc